MNFLLLQKIHPMKAVKIILITLAAIIVGLVVFVLIAGLFVKKDFAVEKEVIIHQPKQLVFDYIKLLKNQNNYSVWAKMDPNMKKTFTGTDGTVGFISAWSSEADSVGQGEQEIKSITEGEKITYELRFKKPFEATNQSYMTTQAIDSNTTKVNWGFFGVTPYPMNVMYLFMDMEAAVGKDLQGGLNNLKAILEK